MTAKQFVIKFMYGFFLLFALVGIFNRIVDPSWYYRDTEIKGFNAVKPEFLSFEQNVKPALLIRDQPEAIVLGSSYSEIGFDPTNRYFTDQGRLKSMNFAFARAPWEKVQCYFEFAVTHSHIKRALVGFHPGNLPLADCSKAAIGQLNTIDLLFTYSALDFSIKTIRKQNESEVTHTPEGMYFYSRGVIPIEYFQQDLKRRADECQGYLNDSKALSHHSNSEKATDLSGLQRMIRTAKERGIELVLFAYPSHAYLLEKDYLCGNQEKKWQIMKQIGEFIETESAGQVPAWQFYGYNDVTAEPVTQNTWYWQDANHFNFEVGNMMLEDMFDKTPDTLEKPKFARPLSADYADFLREREEYLQRHPGFQTNLQWLDLNLTQPTTN